MIAILVSLLMLCLNLVILGVIYWGVSLIIEAIPFPAEIKSILHVLLKVVVVILAVVWIVGWLIGAVSSAAFYVPAFFPYHYSSKPLPYRR